MAPPQKLPPAGTMSPVQRSGSHTSNLTSEFSIRVDPTTRQNAGRSANGLAPAPGGVNCPAGTTWADVTVVFGSACDARRSQGIDAARVCAPAPRALQSDTATTIRADKL